MEKQALIAELLGPAGAGKTTLLQALTRDNQGFVRGDDFAVRRIENIPFFAGNALLLLPTFLGQYGNENARRFTRQEAKTMVCLTAWQRVLRRRASKGGAVTLLDHGPVYRLAWLREFGPGITHSRPFEKWWTGMLEQWAATLDMIIWLDAPDAVLLDRINSRSRWHRVQGKSEQEVYEFLARYRKSFDQVISALTARAGPSVLRFDTDRVTLHQIVARILVALEQEYNKG